MRILIVEDNPTDRQLLRYLLEDKFQNEAKFLEASNLGDAFRYLEGGNIDCVVLDLQLPDSIGRETFERLHRRFPDVPMIVMTHNKDRELAIDMIKTGASDYVIKSYTDEEDIFRRIVFAIEKHQRTVRLPPEKATSVHKLERAKADLLTAHQSGQHQAIQATTFQTTTAIADVASKLFTEMQSLSTKISQQNAQQDHIVKIVEKLEAEILQGSGTRPSMRSQVDLLEHRVTQTERRFSDFKELVDQKFEDLENDVKDAEATQRLSTVQVQQHKSSNRTKILLGILGLLGVFASAIATYEASKVGKTKNDAAQGK